MWRSSNGDKENEFDFILIGNKEIVKDVTVLKPESSDHILVRCVVSLKLRRKMRKLVHEKHPSAKAIRKRTD